VLCSVGMGLWYVSWRSKECRVETCVRQSLSEACRSYLLSMREGMEYMGGWTKADLNRLRHQMSVQQRGIDEIAEEIRHRCGCRS
jgi:hypothetical protein